MMEWKERTPRLGKIRGSPTQRPDSHQESFQCQHIPSPYLGNSLNVPISFSRHTALLYVCVNLAVHFRNKKTVYNIPEQTQHTESTNMLIKHEADSLAMMT
uniref:Uncharacterized protein n=1 Tax=Cacopsylla melanoneura TaxID=428564 RepID=A0A8D9E5T5_9HEMI